MGRALRDFVPWIAFAVVASVVDWRVGALVALGLGVVLLAADRRGGHRLDEGVIEASAAIFFAAIAVLALVAPQSPLRHATGALSSAWLAVTAWGSVAIRRPFTLGIARRSVPEAMWGHPLFYRANLVITAVWASSFTACALVLGAASFAGLSPGSYSTVVQVVGYVVPAVFTVRYQAARRGASVGAGRIGTPP